MSSNKYFTVIICEFVYNLSTFKTKNFVPLIFNVIRIRIHCKECLVT